MILRIQILAIGILSLIACNSQSNVKPISFDKSKDFSILELKRTSDYPSSDKDTLACEHWKLNKTELKKIVFESKSINHGEWHYDFAHLPCEIQGKLLQSKIEYPFTVNGGGWIKIVSVDSIYTLGNYKKENDRYFLTTAWQ